MRVRWVSVHSAPSIANIQNMDDTLGTSLGLEAMEQLRVNETEPISNGEYHYKPLPSPTCIRLLNIVGKNRDGTLRVSLRTVDLRDDPFYHALSYTWGNPHASGVDFTEHFNAVNAEYSVSEKVPILCDDQILHVQRNLFDALSEFQHALDSRERHGGDGDPGLPLKSTLPLRSDFYIWIDAVCINQTDFEERAHQVKMMDQIYRKAAHTTIWLGRADQFSAAAAATVARVASYPRDVFVKSEIEPFRRQGPEVYEKSGLAYTSWMDWCSLAALLKRQWFMRVWIIQEAILSRNLVFLCGKHEISFEHLVAATRNIEARCKVVGWSPSVMFIEAHEIAVPLEHRILRLADQRERRRNEDASQTSCFSLEQLIYDTWVFQSTDPRDKLYGVLGLADAAERRHWVIDYGSSAEEVFARGTRRIIEQSRSLKILSCVQDASLRTIAARPSWVPDYSLPYFNMMCNNGFFSAAWDAQHPQYKTPAVLPSPPGPGSWSRLRLRAAIVDRVVATGDDRTNYVNSSILLDPSWFELALLLKTPYPATGQGRTEVLWRTLCADQDAGSTTCPAPGRFAALFKELVCAMVVVRAELEEEEFTAAMAREAEPPGECASSFAQAMSRAREIWQRSGWDRLSPEQILEKTAGLPKFLGGDEFGWLVFTLIKLQALAVTEERADTPSWEELARFFEEPTYVMRVKHGAEKSLVTPNDGAFLNSFAQRYGKRKLFYTEKGYLGLGPASSMVGDVVCVLPGAAGPFLLRDNDPGSGESAGGEGAWPIPRRSGSCVLWVRVMSTESCTARFWG
ncbi:hypothetical protein VTK26DRAFT_590 [Humicola hyalothermophila]